MWGSLLSVAAGLVAALYIFGPEALDPRRTEWLAGDPATHYLGWAFFRQGSGWSFPLTWTDRIGHPWGLSISHLDSIPLVAVLLRPFSGLLGEPFQYLGLYAALCLVLQAFFGFLLARRVGLTGFPAAALGALFVMLAPALIFRFQGHFALASHWLILASLYCYLRPWAEAGKRRWFLPFLLILAVAAAINPYIAVMCTLLAVAGIARLRLERRIASGAALGMAAASIAVVAASLTTFGFFVGGGTADYAGAGYQEYSLNLLAPLDPMHFGALLHGPLPLAHEFQYEGYNYLGLGLIVLLGAGIVTRLPRLARLRPIFLFRPRVLPLVVVAIISVCMAASATVTLGSVTLLEIPLHPDLERAAAALRATGRLFWPAYYLLVLAALAAVRPLRPGARVAALSLALLLQMADMAPLVRDVRATNRHQPGSPLAATAWRTLGANHAVLLVHPAWQCGIAVTPGGASGYATFGFLAAAQGMATNSYYSGRVGQRDLARHCEEALAPLAAGSLDPSAAYVLGDGLLRELDPARLTTHRCSRVDGFNLCVHDPDAPGLDASIDLMPAGLTDALGGRRLSPAGAVLAHDFLGDGGAPHDPVMVEAALLTLDRLGYVGTDADPPPGTDPRMVTDDSGLPPGSCGYFDTAAPVRTQQGHHLAGWAVLPWREEPADAVLVSYDDAAGRAVLLALGRTGQERPDVAAALGAPQYRGAGWRMVLPLTRVPVPRARLRAWAFDARSGRTCQLAGEAKVAAIGAAGTSVGARRQTASTDLPIR